MRNSENPAHSPAWALLAFVVVFIIYGSLFPFDFRGTPGSLDSLLSRYSIFDNTADAIDNFLLFVPLGFSLRICFRRTRNCLAASFLAILLLGLGLQLIQLHLPSRTASLADVFWNGMGLAAGLLVAGVARTWFDRRRASSVTADPFALLLVLLWFFYEAFPFIPTLDVGLLREHVKSVVFAPPFETMRFVQHLLAAILGGIALQRTRLFSHGGLSTALAGATAVLLEILVAYGGLRRETLLGMLSGLAGGYLLARNGDRTAMITLAIVAASAYLITISTPYRGQIADARFTFTPFSSFMWHNATRELPPLAFEALAIGSLLWAGLFKTSWFHHRPAPWVGTAFLAIVALEFIRVFAIGIHGDTTTLVIAAVLGPFAAAYRNLPGAAPDRPIAATPVVQHTRHRHDQPPWSVSKTCAISTVLLAIAIYVAAHLPGIPYNIRELLPAGIGGVIAAVSLSLILYLGANSPFLLLTSESRRLLVLFPLLLPLQGIIIWILLRIGVPMESIGDIVGAPVLDWPWEWEILLRFLALHQVIATQMVGAILLVAMLCRPSLLAGFVFWLIVSLLFAWPLHLVVVDWAATDNLTELMRDNAAFTSSSLLAAGCLFVSIGGATVGAAVAIPARRMQLLIVAVLSAPLALGCFHAGLEPVLFKYGKVYSAAQFLLGSDRDQHLSQSALLIRFALAYALAIASIAILQLRAWNFWARNIAGHPNEAGTRNTRRWRDGTNHLK